MNHPTLVRRPTATPPPFAVARWILAFALVSGTTGCGAGERGATLASMDGGADGIEAAQGGCNDRVAPPSVTPVFSRGPGPAQGGGTIAAGTYVLHAIEEYDPCTSIGNWAPVPWGRVLSFAPASGLVQAAESFLDTERGQIQSETSSSVYQTDGAHLSFDTFCTTGSIAEPETSPGEITYTATSSQLVVENEVDCPLGSPGIEFDVFTYGK